MVIIDGATFNVPVTSLSRTADFLDKFAQRTEDGVLHRELIGVYFNYQLQFGRPTSVEERQEYARLWGKLTEPVEFHKVVVPNTMQGDLLFEAYFSNVGDELMRQRGQERYWRSLTVNFIAREPAATAI